MSNPDNKGPLSAMSPVAFIFFALVVVFILYQIVGGLITYLMMGEDLDLKDGNLGLMRLILTFAQFMFVLFPAVLLVMLQDNNPRETFRLYKPKIPVFVLAILGILVVQPFLQVYLFYQNEIIFNLPFAKDFIKELKQLLDTMEAQTQKLVEAKSISEFLIIVIVIAVTPAICEEFLFRGLVFKNFEKVLPASKAIFFTGFLFALFHFHPFNLIPLTVLGIFLTFIVYHSGSIYTSVFCHFLNNFISSLAVFIFGTDSFSADTNTGMASSEKIQFILLGLISLVAFITVIFLIKKFSVTKNQSVIIPPSSNE